MSVAPASTSSVLVAVSGVLQDPSTYSVSGTTLTFSGAPPSGTSNISVRYLGIPASGVTTTAYRTVTEFTATAGQTTFSVPSYTVGFIDVYRNGVMLGSADYTATNGTTVVLTTGATSGDLVEVISFQVSSVLNAIPATAGSVGTTYLADSSVTTAKITNANVTMAKLDSTAQYTGFKNRLINGAMVIDQRNAGASVTPTSGAVTYTLDRWSFFVNQASKLTTQQNAGSVTPPTGFTNYLGVTSSSSYSVGASDRFLVKQDIEGFNIADLGWGTANASPVTLSFWVRSSLTGTFGGSLKNNNGTRSYPFNYTISAANTWEQKSITVAGDTTGTWLTNASSGIILNFGLGTGSTFSGTAGAWASSNFDSVTGATSVVGTNGATFYITGVQLEKGSTATSFDYRPYSTEFDLCRRYAEVYSGGTNEEGSIPQYFAQVDSANRPEIMITYYPKRTGPTFTLSGNFAWNSAANTGMAATYSGAFVGTFTRGTNLFFGVASGVSTNSLSGVGMILFGSSGGGKIIIDAEL
jgi:hypothetical protein